MIGFELKKVTDTSQPISYRQCNQFSKLVYRMIAFVTSVCKFLHLIIIKSLKNKKIVEPESDINRKVVDLTDQNRALIAQIESSNIREEASAKRLNKVRKQLASTQSELKVVQKKAEVADQKLDLVMKELAALREEIQKMKQK